ncbi:hypothetical protein [Nonomuraea sp. NPDC049309]|uniref:hypothetical protein n=1 Tax=Nonomuraea sp. NPDC049309 TaxID=3364350 RepID=UPI00371B686B
MIRNRVLAGAVRLELLLNRHAVRRGLDPERGASTVEWVIIAAVLFILAVTVGTKITSVVNEQLAKIK